MTSVSLAIALVAALLAGPLIVLLFRGNSAWGFGIASAIGFVLLQASSVTDLLRPFQPRQAIDWMPALSLAATACVSIRQVRYRIWVALGLALLIPIRLLWGSLYFQSDSIGPALVAAIGCWSFSLAVALWCPENGQRGRRNWKAVAWATIVAVVAMTFTMSGSFTYCAAAGIVGAALLGTLISTAQPPNVAAFPLIVLIGLSVAYAELQFSVAISLIAGLIGLVSAENFSTLRLAVVARVMAVAVVVIAGGVTASQFAKKFNSSSNAIENYRGSAYDRSAAPNDDALETDRLPRTKNIESIDPFGGLSREP